MYKRNTNYKGVFMMREDESIVEKVTDFIGEVNWWDKFFLFLYIVIFGSIGLLMSNGYIKYAKTVNDLFSNDNGIYTFYLVTFICMFVCNIIVIATLIFNKNSAFRLLNNKLKYDYEYFELEKIVGSIFTFFIVLFINLMLFPMFQLIYGLILLGLIIVWLMVS